MALSQEVDDLDQLNEASKAIKLWIKDYFPSDIRVLKRRVESGKVESVIYSVDIAVFTVPQDRQSHEVTIAIDAEKTTNGDRVFACYFWSSSAAARLLLAYARFNKKPMDGTQEYENNKIFYNNIFVRQIRNNPYVFEINDDAKHWSSLSYYTYNNLMDSIGLMTDFIRSVIISLPQFADAIDDIGTDVADRAAAVATKFVRDPEVRRQVMRRANGACEFCGAAGFERADGSLYLECHHVIALAKDGADRLTNVIALCPGDHREAHFGKQAEALEEKMIAKLQVITGR